MAALSATRFDPILRSLYQRQQAQRKLFKVVITAAMRKLLIHLNTVLKNAAPLPHTTTS